MVQTLINELQSSNCKNTEKEGNKAKTGLAFNPVHVLGA
jgi:hypothetical protein